MEPLEGKPIPFYLTQCSLLKFHWLLCYSSQTEFILSCKIVSISAFYNPNQPLCWIPWVLLWFLVPSISKTQWHTVAEGSNKKHPRCFGRRDANYICYLFQNAPNKMSKRVPSQIISQQNISSACWIFSAPLHFTGLLKDKCMFSIHHANFWKHTKKLRRVSCYSNFEKTVIEKRIVSKLNLNSHFT